jgi:hypothetical protein
VLSTLYVPSINSMSKVPSFPDTVTALAMQQNDRINEYNTAFNIDDLISTAHS